MLDLVGELRRNGTPVAILTNGTSTIPQEMDELGLTKRFDAISNSAQIGYANPDTRAFQHVCNALSVDPSRVFFTDCTPSELAGAIELGMTAETLTSMNQLRSTLMSFGLLRGGS